MAVDIVGTKLDDASIYDNFVQRPYILSAHYKLSTVSHFLAIHLAIYLVE